MRIRFIYKALVLFLLVLFCSTNKANATHIIGGELYYTKLDSSLYEVTLKIYRDCYNGVPWFDTPARIKVFNGNDSLVFIQYVDLTSWSYLDPHLDSLCIVIPPDVCVQEAIYVDTLNLPYSPGGYGLSYTRCCRNATILNIEGPDTTGITLYSTIPDSSIAMENSSPRFNNFPPILICANEVLEFDHSATDLDGDSISYSLCTPYTGGNIPNIYGVNPVEAPPYPPINWIQPFNAFDPLGGTPLTIDSSGFLTGVPNMLGQFVVGVCAEEYRNDTLISVNRRDFQFNVSSCEPVPSAAIPANLLVCGDSVNNVLFDIESVTNSLTFSWDFGDTTTLADTSHVPRPEYQYPDTGYYDIRLIVNEGYTCEDTGYATVYVQPGTDAKFSSTNVCFPEYTTLNSQAFSFGNSLEIEWLLEPGVTSTANSLVYSFPQSGSYPISLVASNEYGCFDTLTKNIQIYAKPNADFGVTSGCSGDTIQLSDSTQTVAGEGIYFQQWNMGDGNVLFGGDPEHLYTSTGNFQLTYIVQNNFGCRDTTTKMLTIGPKPIADFIADQGCTGDPTLLNNISVGTDSIASNIWWIDTLQEGSTDKHAVFYFAAPGSFDVKLVVETNLGCKDSVVKTVDVYYDPTAQFITEDVCYGDTAIFTNQSTVQGGTIANNLWLLEAGASSTFANINHVFSEPGEYVVQLISASNEGCVDTTESTVNVHYLPEVGFVSNKICLNDSTDFLDTSLVQQSTIEWVNWAFGDGELGTGMAVNHLYQNAGQYSVVATAYSDEGCNNTLTKIIDVYPLPVANFSVGNVCQGETTHYFDASQSADTIVEWIYSLGNILIDSMPNTQNTYANYGVYNSQLVITTANGCKDSIMKSHSIYATPAANYSFDSNCDNEMVDFFDNSTIPDGSITNWFWDFDDGNQAYSVNESHQFSSKGLFNVQLIVESNFGCADTIVQEVYKLEQAIADFSIGKDKNCEQLETSVSAVGDTSLTYYWITSDGQTFTSKEEELLFEKPGVYGIKLIVENLEGCKDSLDLNTAFTVYEGVEADFVFTPDEATIYDPSFQFVGAGVNAVHYNWNFGDSTTSSGTMVEHIYGDTGVFNVDLIATSQYGCTDTITKEIGVSGATYNFYIPNTFTPTGNGLNDTFNGKGVGIAEYSLTIYDRWGEQIFSSTDKDQGWGGNYRNTLSKQGTYVYLFQITDVVGEKHRYLGHVNLLW